MEFTFKTYKITKTENYLKKNTFFFFFEGINRDSNNWIVVEQNLKNIRFNYYKIFNEASEKTLNKSIYLKLKPMINGITFLIKPKTDKLSKQILITNFESLLFNILVIKLNNKMYQKAHLKNNYSLNYDSNKLLIFQYKITNLKKSK